MIKQVYILFGSPVSQAVYEYLGRDIIKNNGLELKVFDLSPIIYPALYKNATITKDYEGSDKQVVFNVKQN